MACCCCRMTSCKAAIGLSTLSCSLPALWAADEAVDTIQLRPNRQWERKSERKWTWKLKPRGIFILNLLGISFLLCSLSDGITWSPTSYILLLFCDKKRLVVPDTEICIYLNSSIWIKKRNERLFSLNICIFLLPLCHHISAGALPLNCPKYNHSCSLGTRKPFVWSALKIIDSPIL